MYNYIIATYVEIASQTCRHNSKRLNIIVETAKSGAVDNTPKNG